MGKVIYLKDFLKNQHGTLEGKVVVGSDVRPAQAVNLAITNRSLQVVTDGFDESLALKISENPDDFVRDPGEYLLGQDSNGIGSFQQKFFRQSKKDDFLFQIETYLKSGQHRRVRDDIYLIADELFTNFAKSSAEDSKTMVFGIENDKDTVMIYCRDQQGALDPHIMLQSIQRCYQQGVKASIRMDSKGGAGIGSFLMYSVSTGMAIIVEPGKHSMVLLWMPRKAHHEDRVDMNKNLFVISGKGE
ncbi:MAG: hypothetical protein KDD33_02005 [Bdellovibrionales bacterium]|nr:hypothetical protein [Bdellovibrionales bacterium]